MPTVRYHPKTGTAQTIAPGSNPRITRGLLILDQSPFSAANPVAGEPGWLRNNVTYTVAKMPGTTNR